MGINKVFWECPICNYGSITEEIVTDQDERFINCVRCGCFYQSMLKVAIKNIDKLKEMYPDYTETDKHITIKSGGWGSWKIIQKENTHEGSFVDRGHIQRFIDELDQMLAIEDVIEIKYSIRNMDGEWIEIIKEKN